ncbi:LTA synthase family protein [Lacticaseibacillus zhaodongensis]|uniref:LTA synthase family protein n=1 Tax=Lacticaseibacillus zhaodongensis TaxID=2668065 RepID=UPI0018AFDDCF|nr:LTA synthase family protein [Lacticaseibacillus zhaodongensis]
MLNANAAFKSRSVSNQILRYYLWRRPARFWIVFPIFWFYLLFSLHITSEREYLRKRWGFINSKPLSTAEWQNLRKRLPLRQQFRHASGMTVCDAIPQFILDLLLKDSGLKAQGLPTNADGSVVPSSSIAAQYDAAVNETAVVTPDFYRHFLRHASSKQQVHIFDLDREFSSYAKYQWAQLLWQVRNIGTILVAALITTAIALYIGYNQFSPDTVSDILVHGPKLMLANTLIVFLLMLLFYFICNSIGWGIIIGGVPVVVLAIVNYFMLEYRNFPFEFPDIFLASEAGDMGKHYSYVPPLRYTALLIGVVIMAVVAQYLLKKSRRGFSWRLVTGLVTVAAIVVSTKSFYLNDDEFNAIAPITHGNIWEKNNRDATNGFVYSFMNTLNKGQVLAPKGYTKAAAVKSLNKYTYKNIPKNKRVNVIEIQLEAFQDFSKYPQINIDPGVYAGLHKVQSEAMHGELTTTIFGGGTVDTERKALTGFTDLPNIRTNTNSFTDYFKQQGYNTYSAHAGYAWFYNRQNINRYLGFPTRLFKENYYNDHVSKAPIIPDTLVFNDLVKQINNRTKNGKYVYNQTVTYQNHGPYPTTFSGQPVVKWQSGYNKSDYAIINNYLTGVEKTSNALLALVNQLQNSKKPVVLAFWGDHNPWGGLNNSTYKMLGINLDQSTQQGFGNFYDTPYVMWANNAAKKRLKTQFTGVGPTISPMYILPTIFQHTGWQGNQYMQTLANMQKTIPVFGKGKDMYQGTYTPETSLPKNVQTKINEFRTLQYYVQTVYQGNARKAGK